MNKKTLIKELNKMILNQPKIEVLSDISGRVYSNPKDVKLFFLWLKRVHDLKKEIEEFDNKE